MTGPELRDIIGGLLILADCKVDRCPTFNRTNPCMEITWPDGTSFHVQVLDSLPSHPREGAELN